MNRSFAVALAIVAAIVVVVVILATGGPSDAPPGLPGDMTLDTETLTISLDPSQIDGFPGSFEWRLQTTLDGDAADPSSGMARDIAPDAGLGTVEDG